MANILRIRKKIATIQEVEDPQDPGQAIYDPDKLRDLLSSRYRALFASDVRKNMFAVGSIDPITKKEVTLQLN